MQCNCEPLRYLDKTSAEENLRQEGIALKWRTVAIVGAVLFLAGFLLGFIPQYRKVSTLTTQLETARLQSKLREIRELASLSYMDASRRNYGSASDDSERMFTLATEVASDTKDDALRTGLQGLVSFRDTVKSKLAAADASVLEPLQQIVQKSQSELNR